MPFSFQFVVSGLVLVLPFKVNVSAVFFFLGGAQRLSLDARVQGFNNYRGPDNYKDLQHFIHWALIKVSTARERK